MAAACHRNTRTKIEVSLTLGGENACTFTPFKAHFRPVIGRKNSGNHVFVPLFQSKKRRSTNGANNQY
jgi:hypothetical protein